MKKFLIILGTLLVLIIATAIALPMIFKDDIKVMIDEELAKSVNADVLFELDNFSVSLFPNFPNATVAIKELGVIGKDEFAGEILFAVEKFEIEINLKKILFDDALSIQGIDLTHPEIFIRVLEDGTANYDIAIASEEIEETPVEEPTDDFSFAIEHWSITNGHIIYDDKSLPFYMELQEVDHSGSGDFTLEVFDMQTKTHASSFTMSYDGEEYMSKKSVDLDMVLNMDLNEFKFTFKENVAKVNDFSMGFDGWFSMPDENMHMDLGFATKNNSFKSLLSLVPGAYTADFADIKTSGSLQFDGFVRGTYNATKMPAFNVNMKVADGMFQYPDLPTAVTNINMDMLIDNKDGNIDNTLVDIKSLHLDFGNNPVDASLRIENLVTYPIEAKIDVSLNLEELLSMFPMEGLELKGTYKLNATANGVYDSIRSIIPKIDVAMSLENGYVKSSEFPKALENLNMKTTIVNSTGAMADTKINVETFDMIMDGKNLHADMTIENLDDYTWDVNLDGAVDLGKLFPVINELYPMPGTSMAGIISAKMNTKGKMSDLDAERYDKLPTSGSMFVSGFNYTDEEYLPMGFNISEASASFDPQRIDLSKFDATVGNTDMRASGVLTNYMGFMLHDNEVLKGTLQLSSNQIDLNEWMVEEETTEETDTTLVPLEVIPIPSNIDFVIDANVGKVIYSNMDMKNAKGKLIVRNSAVNMQGLSIDMLGGNMVVNGSYDTKDVSAPKIDFDMAVNNVSISESFNTFNTIQKLAPIAQNINGNVTTNFKLSGLLGEDMMPKYESLTGGGLLEIAQAALVNSKIVSGVTSLIKSNANDSEQVNLKDILMSVSIKDGRMAVKPFDVKLGGYKTTVAGSTGLTGDLDYTLAMDIPAGQAGAQLNSLVSSLTGTNNTSGSNVKVNIGLGGTFTNPKPKLLTADAKETIKTAVVDAAKEKATGVVKTEISDAIGVDVAKINQDSLKAAANAEIEKQKALAVAKLKATQDSLKVVAEAKAKKAAEDAAKKAQNAIKDLFKKKKKNN